MRLGVKPHVFLARLLVAFAATYFLWIPVAPFYTRALAALTRVTLNATEVLTGQPKSIVMMRQTSEGRPAIYYAHGRFAQVESGIPAEWVQANLVLLIPLMLAVPAVSYRQRFTRLAVAVLATIVLQVLDVMVTIKALYASFPPAGYGSFARRVYQFADAFAQSFDTQLFPFLVWAGVHFNQLLGRTPAPPEIVNEDKKKSRSAAKKR